MRFLSIVGFSHFKSFYDESDKTILLHVARKDDVWVTTRDQHMDEKLLKKQSKNAAYEPSQARAVSNIESWQIY